MLGEKQHVGKNQHKMLKIRGKVCQKHFPSLVCPFMQIVLIYCPNMQMVLSFSPRLLGLMRYLASGGCIGCRFGVVTSWYVGIVDRLIVWHSDIDTLEGCFMGYVMR